MASPLDGQGCERCGGTRIVRSVERFGGRNQPMRSTCLMCTCDACGHRWSEAITSLLDRTPDATA